MTRFFHRVFALVGLTSHLAVANDGFAASGDAAVGPRQPSVFRVQPTMESVREWAGLEETAFPGRDGFEKRD